MAEKTQRIGIFDSGLGGTTVLKELINSLPNEDYIYYGDNGNFPYGSGKTKNELQKLTERILDFFVKNNCKLDYLDNYHFGSFAVCKISTEYLQKSNVNILSHYSGDAMCWIHLTFPLRR